MITKVHIASFVTVILLYAGVAIWKWTPYNSEADSGSENITNESSGAPENQFWDYYDQATQLRSQGLYREAAEQYSNALEINSGHKDALYYAGSMYLMARDFEQADHKWNQLLREESNAPRTHLQLGTLYFCMDQENLHFDLKKAYQYFSRAWKLNLEETGAPLLLAKIHLLNNDPDQAERLLSDILSLNTTNEQALFLMGFINWQSGKKQKARQFLSRSVAYLNRDRNSGHAGEGTTKTGNAMLLQDRFCDRFETAFKTLVQDQPGPEAGDIYPDFEKRISAWRDEFEIKDKYQLSDIGQ